MVHVVPDIGRVEPRECKGQVNGAPDGHDTEQVVEDVALLTSKDKTKLALLETINLQMKNESQI